MPHSLFLGSHLATQDRESKASIVQISILSDKAPEQVSTSDRGRLRYLGSAIWRSCKSLFIVEELGARPKSHEHRKNNSLEFIRLHINHAMVDVVSSLLGFAVIINALYASIVPPRSSY